MNPNSPLPADADLDAIAAVQAQQAQARAALLEQAQQEGVAAAQAYIAHYQQAYQRELARGLIATVLSSEFVALEDQLVIEQAKANALRHSLLAMQIYHQELHRLQLEALQKS